MQGLITLDFGNTNPHAGLFQKHGVEWTLVKVVPLHELAIFADQLGFNAANSQLVLAEVKSRDEEITNLQQQGYLLTRVSDYWRGERFAGMPVHYAKTIGEDRLISAFYTYKKDKTPTLLIDAGTFVTMDVIDESGLRGGYIFPGPQIYFNAYAQGDRLKEVRLNSDFSTDLPKDTVAAMRDSYRAFGELGRAIVAERNIARVILTGGGASRIKTYFPTAIQIDNYIHWAIHYWMTTQVEPA